MVCLVCHSNNFAFKNIVAVWKKSDFHVFRPQYKKWFLERHYPYIYIYINVCVCVCQSPVYKWLETFYLC
jgi:hypothetical protein